MTSRFVNNGAFCEVFASDCWMRLRLCVCVIAHSCSLCWISSDGDWQPTYTRNMANQRCQHSCQMSFHEIECHIEWQGRRRNRGLVNAKPTIWQRDTQQNESRCKRCALGTQSSTI
eukprot:4350410-Amphidinium_carterae.1